MSNVINIDVQRSGFPVKIGGVELWFDMSLENIQKFLLVEQLANEKLVLAQEAADALNLPDELTPDSLNHDDAQSAIFIHKEFIKAHYDITFGDGSFDKLYEQIPDVIALEDTYKVVGVAIANRVGELQEERNDNVNAQIKKMMDKKKKKKK